MSTAPSKAPNAQHPSQHTSPHSSASKGALVGHSTPTAVQLPHTEPEPSPALSISPFLFSWKLQEPTATPSTSSSQCSFTFNLHRCKSTTQGKRESAFFSSQRWRDALFSLVQPPFLKVPCVIWTCYPLPSLPVKEITDSHTTSCTAATQSARFPTRERRRAKEGICDERLPVLSLLS